jgi:hypothetical protein
MSARRIACGPVTLPALTVSLAPRWPLRMSGSSRKLLAGVCGPGSASDGGRMMFALLVLGEDAGGFWPVRLASTLMRSLG